MTFDWSNAEIVGLAKESCTHCLGNGLRRRGRVQGAPCTCVLRQVFRICFNRFKLCASKIGYVGRTRLEPRTGNTGRYCWAMKDEEYMADFCLVSRRALDEEEYQIFRFHFLLGADWKLCCRRLGMDRGTFFHQVYRIEQKLGRVYRELRPHPLFPLDEYFGGSVRSDSTRVIEMQARPPATARHAGPLRAPLRKVA